MTRRKFGVQGSKKEKEGAALIFNLIKLCVIAVSGILFFLIGAVSSSYKSYQTKKLNK
ncbi:MAG: hypothetical protein K0S53_376 [Bacteroidetes bacterium]|jgi:hypothetical protein|nr:hypothetical protein [Bacteroidota bacterium]